MLFVDTSFLVAFTLVRDSAHRRARELGPTLLSEELCTSELVLGEVWTLLRRRAGHHAAQSWLDFARGMPGMRVQAIDDTLTEEAWTWLHTHDERAYSFVDATSFALMRKLRLTDELAFDGDFAAAGFNELAATA
ncbi:MAG: PIN domain-containing protein [Gaiellales bacterium]